MPLMQPRGTSKRTSFLGKRKWAAGCRFGSQSWEREIFWPRIDLTARRKRTGEYDRSIPIRRIRVTRVILARPKDTRPPKRPVLYLQFSVGARSNVQESASQSDGDCMRPVVGLEFVHQVLYMKINRVFRDGQLIGNLFVAITVTNEPENF